MRIFYHFIFLSLCIAFYIVMLWHIVIVIVMAQWLWILLLGFRGPGLVSEDVVACCVLYYLFIYCFVLFSVIMAQWLLHHGWPRAWLGNSGLQRLFSAFAS